MKKISIIISILSSLFFTACEVANFDLQENPNSLSPDLVDPNLLLNGIQDLFEDAMVIVARNTDDVMRYEAMTDVYTDIAEPSALDGEWTRVFRLRENTKILENLVAQNEDLRFHRGIAKVLRAYATVTLVDYFGDIPFFEANNAVEIPNPMVTSGEEVYAAVLSDIDLAIEDFNNVELRPDTDLYFDGDEDKWIKFANSLKLKMLVNIGDQTRLNALLAEDNFIETIDEDFQFNYGITAVPESRHPYFQRGYLPDGFSQYIGNYFLWLLKDSKTVRDPRLRYYIYRQSARNITTCGGEPIFDFCYVGDFYSGRDHGDDGGSPSDGQTKTTYGVYPAGGTFDADNPDSGERSPNLGGAGIFPILLSSYVKFLRAEAALSIGTTGDPAALLEAGIRASMNKVLNFKNADEGSPFAATNEDVDAYVTAVMTEYNAATNETKLDIVMREYYLSSFGNAIESYNGYRRTGFPSNLQIPIKNESNPFPRTYSYPDDVVDTNSNIRQRPITTQVFWDTNPAGFIQ
ncbi:SusD/RagB family nutrient-binding outer membrane lipoprotein [Aquimarina aggregata]|uniref:SusD/RagB family nutrient-binding outer membrane lipoprotein n=1 Tax=Aquimarina aggregata TaxID=1642818 RepID=UPI00249120AE|nr:SusD/RagB family nutrient-binding outer membrane lipoprotein [Aquimarina aggregata]